MIIVYRRVFAAPGAVGGTVAGFAARMAHYMTVLGIVLLVSATSGSYGSAGVASAGYALVYAALSPVTSRLVDRVGPRRVLIPVAAGNIAARAALLAAAWWAAPGWVLVTLAAASGATMPAVGPLVRARWSRTFRDSPLLHPALSVESVVDEVVLIVGPVLVTVLATDVHPAAGLLATLLLATGGLAALAAGAPPAEPARPTGRPGRAVLTTPGFAPLLATFVLVAMATVTIEIAVVAVARDRSGWILATMALTSALCGLWYGARRWRPRPRQRLVWAVALFTVSSLGFVAAPNVATLFATAAATGLTLAPTFIDGFSTAHGAVPAHRLTEGLTWLTTAAGTGVALGSVAAGLAIDAYGPRVAFALAVGCAAAAVPTALLTRFRAPEPG